MLVHIYKPRVWDLGGKDPGLWVQTAILIRESPGVPPPPSKQRHEVYFTITEFRLSKGTADDLIHLPRGVPVCISQCRTLHLLLKSS